MRALGMVVGIVSLPRERVLGVLAAALGVVALMSASVALAASGPSVVTGPGASPSNLFSPGVPQSPLTQNTPATPTIITPTTSTPGSSGLSSSSAIAIALGAVVVLTGISLFIWRDARRRAPVRHAAVADDGDRARTGSKPRTKPRKLSPAERRRRKRGRAR
ncbi:MAG: hypothetical protein ACYC91_05645 [Solirubrobacteraceae bacterium]